MKTIKILATATLAALLPLPSAHAGSADEIAIQQVASRLAETAVTYASRGWHLHDFDPDFIEQGDHIDYTIHLNAGDEMIFRGLGDSDAVDLDIAVFSPTGRLVKNDSDYDATPYVSFTAQRSGTYTIRFGVVSCRANGSYCALLVAER